MTGPAGWRDYYDGLTVYLMAAGKYRNLGPEARAVAFWAAAGAQELAASAPVNLAALRTAVPELLRRNPVLDAFRLGRVAAWIDPRFALDERFVGLAFGSLHSRVDATHEVFGDIETLRDRAVSPAARYGAVVSPTLLRSRSRRNRRPLGSSSSNRRMERWSRVRST
jgi:hypothetical protein